MKFGRCGLPTFDALTRKGNDRLMVLEAMSADSIVAPVVDVQQVATQIEAAARRQILGADTQIHLIVAALLAGGHVLLQDVPGVGKTSLARCLASALGGTFRRIQGAADLLPSDIVGTSVYNPVTGDWTVRTGPLFANVVLLDEIGQVPPRAQAALLESMEEHTATIDGLPRPLPRPNWLIATRNPSRSGGFALTDALADRFSVATSLGYPPTEAECALVANPTFSTKMVDGALYDLAQLAQIQHQILRVTIVPKVASYLVALCDGTRSWPGVSQGASPRAVLAMAALARSLAATAGRDFVTPDDVQAAVRAGLPHRLRLSDGDPEGVVNSLIADTPVPRRS